MSVLELDSLRSLSKVSGILNKIAKQLAISNGLQKVKMCYEFNDRLEGLQLPEDEKQKRIDDFNQAIDMAFEAAVD